MRAILRIKDLRLPAGTSWPENGAVTRLLERLDRSPLWHGLDHSGRTSDGLTPFASVAEAARRAAGWELRSIIRFATGREEPWPCHAFWQSHEHGLALTLVLEDEAVRAHARDLVAEARALVVELRAALAPASIGPTLDLRLLDVDRPRLRPPRRFGLVEPDTLMAGLDRRYITDDRRATPDDWAALLAADLPAGARRTETDDLATVTWIDDLSDPQRIARRLAEQERFLTTLLDPPIDSEWNTRGDQRVDVVSQARHEVLTFYDGAAATGFKATVLIGGAPADPEPVARLRAWLADRALPDGRPLEAGYLILPNRNAALAAYRSGLTDGLTGALYVEDEEWWDPQPPGTWADDDGGGGS